MTSQFWLASGEGNKKKTPFPTKICGVSKSGPGTHPFFGFLAKIRSNWKGWHLHGSTILVFGKEKNLPLKIIGELTLLGTITHPPTSRHFWVDDVPIPVWWDMLVSWRVLSLKSVRLHQIYLKHHKYHQLLINRIPDEHATNQWHLSAPKKYRTRFLGLKTIELRNWHPWNWNQELKKIIVKKKHVFWWSFLLGAVWNW